MLIPIDVRIARTCVILISRWKQLCRGVCCCTKIIDHQSINAQNKSSYHVEIIWSLAIVTTAPRMSSSVRTSINSVRLLWKVTQEKTSRSPERTLLLPQQEVRLFISYRSADIQSSSCELRTGHPYDIGNRNFFKWLQWGINYTPWIPCTCRSMSFFYTTFTVFLIAHNRFSSMNPSWRCQMLFIVCNILQ